MNGTVELHVTHDVLSIKGQINFDNVVQATEKGLKLMKRLERVKVDLQGLKQSDSSGLALLVEWTRAAAKRDKKIVFLNIPKFVQDLARVSGIDTLLPSE